jgi:O-antigen/teichoic acid export membrane protein
MSALASVSRVAPLPSAPSGVCFGSQATHGAFWSILFSVFTKCVTLGTQIALAWFLVPEDFGLAAMTLSVISLGVVFSGAHLRNILIQQPARFQELAGQVFWFSAFLTVFAAGLLACLSPLAARLLQEPRVVPLILMAVLASPIQSLGTIYSASLNRDLRFRQVASIQFASGLAQNGFAVVLAMRGWGAYALIGGLLAGAVTLALLFRWVAGRIPIGRPRPSLWCGLLSPVSWLMVNALFSSMLLYGVNLIIGWRLHDPVVTGYYYWGFSVASQTIFLLATNLQVVLFPVFSKLNSDRNRQFEAVRKAGQTLLIAVIPACLLQILLAGPVISWVFHDRWKPAIPVVQWLSLAMMTQPLNIMATSVFLARGRYRALAFTNGVAAVSLLLGAWAGSYQGAQVEIARVAGLSLGAANLFAGWMVFREFRKGFESLAVTLAAPFLAALPAAAAGALTLWILWQRGWFSAWIVVAPVSLGIYGLLIRLLVPQVASDILIRLWPRWKGREHWRRSQAHE